MDKVSLVGTLNSPFTSCAYTMCVGYMHGVGVFTSFEVINNKREIFAGEIGHRPTSYDEVFPEGK